MNPRYAAALGLVGWYLMVPSARAEQPTPTLGIPIPQASQMDSSEVDAQKPDEPPELTPEESAERQRLRDLQAPVDAAIAKYFSSKPSERKGGLDRWYYNGHYLGHVLGVGAMAIMSPDTTLQPRERRQGDEIGVEIDKDENIGEVERQLPSKLDGVPVEIYPMPIVESY